MRLKRTRIFDEWLGKLKDFHAVNRIGARIARLEEGNPGDCKKLPGGDVTEMRIDYGGGYRVYYTRQGSGIILLLIGGDKKTQRKDIQTALEMSENLREGKDDDRY